MNSGIKDVSLEQVNAALELEIEELREQNATFREQLAFCQHEKAEVERRYAALEGAVREAIDYIERDCEACSVGVKSPCDRCMTGAAEILRKAVEA